MSNIAQFEKLYYPTDLNKPFWNRFVEIEGFKKFSKGYLSHRLDQLLSQNHSACTKGIVEKRDFGKWAIVFVDGFFSKEFSSLPEGVILLSLEEAFHTYGAFLHGRIQKMATKEKSAFYTLNGALTSHSAFLYLPGSTAFDEPISIVHLFSQQFESSIASPRLQIIVGKNSHIRFVNEQGCGSGIWNNQAVDLHLEEGAHVEWLNLCDVNQEGFLSDSFRATLKADCVLTMHVITKGIRGCIRDYHVELLGERAEAKILAALNLSEKCHEQIEILMEHKVPTCVSDQHIKHIGHEASRHSFIGTIYVHPEAQKSASYQKHSALLLDQSAFSVAQPQLEIFADDVKASHGATVGQIDEESLFYLTARGIARADAYAILMNAHLKEITDSIALSSLKERAYNLVS